MVPASLSGNDGVITHCGLKVRLGTLESRVVGHVIFSSEDWADNVVEASGGGSRSLSPSAATVAIGTHLNSREHDALRSTKESRVQILM